MDVAISKVELEVERHVLRTKVLLSDKTEGLVFTRSKTRNESNMFNYICHLCGVNNLPGERCLQVHIAGRKHQMKLQSPIDAKAFRSPITRSKPQISMKIAPGEPVPPGFENEVKQQAEIQPALDRIKDEALVGLEYITELVMGEGKEASYHCVLCDKRGDPRTILHHITSYNHRLKYLEKHFPTVIREISAFRYNKDARDIMPRILQGVCEAIEDCHGRLTPFVYEYNSYMRNRMKYLQEIVADRHFDEKMGSTFISVIDRKAIMDAISSGNKNFNLSKRKRESSPPSVRVVKRPKAGNRSDRNSLDSISSASSTSMPKSPRRHRRVVGTIDLRSRSRSPSISPVRRDESSKLKMMFEAFTEVSGKLVATIDRETADNYPLGVGDILSRFVTDVLGSTEFGIDCNSLEDKHSKFYEMALKDFASFSFLKRILLGTFRDLGRRLHLSTTDKEIATFYTDVLEKTIKFRKENPHVRREDLMSLLIKLKNSLGSDALNFNQIAAQTYVFSVAGIETSAAAITFCIFELSLNEEIQKKARESVHKALIDNGGLTYEALNEMQYLQQCISEALRLYPPVPSVSRVANADYLIPNTNIVIEKGTSIIIPIYSIHTDPDIYPEPQKFDPNRISAEEVSKRHPFSFLAFGGGPRSCMAPRYANLLVKIAMVEILRNFDFALDHEKTKVPLKMAPEKLVFWPREAVFIKFNKIAN